MSRKNHITLASSVLILALLACNLPTQSGGEPPADSDLAATITAQALTIQAPGGGQEQPTAVDSAPTNTSVPTETPTITFTPTETLTPTPSVPMVSVSENTNCRTGPGTQYDLIGALNTGQSSEVVGKYSPSYWIIKNPGNTGNCWLWGQYATVTGNTANLPEYPAPPTPTPSLPEAPKAFNVNISCVTNMNPVFHKDVSINMSWTDLASNEDGYRVYRNGDLLYTLDANSTGATDSTTLPAIWLAGNPTPSVTYGVEAFNSAGTSARKEKTVICP